MVRVMGCDQLWPQLHLYLKPQLRFITSTVRLANSPLALRILSPLFMSPQVGPWEQAERGPVSIRNTGRHNGLCLQLHCWQTPTQRSWKGSPSVLTHTEEWVSVLPLRAVFVQYIQLLSMATVLPSMGAEVLMKTRRKGHLCCCQQEFMFIRWALPAGWHLCVPLNTPPGDWTTSLLDGHTTGWSLTIPSHPGYHWSDCTHCHWPWNQILQPCDRLIKISVHIHLFSGFILMANFA